MKKRTVPKILPREPLTKKAKEAITKYASIRGGKVDYMAGFMVEIVLKAERMRRADLYAYLEKKGYRWNGRWWHKKELR